MTKKTILARNDPQIIRQCLQQCLELAQGLVHFHEVMASTLSSSSVVHARSIDFPEWTTRDILLLDRCNQQGNGHPEQDSNSDHSMKLQWNFVSWLETFVDVSQEDSMETTSIDATSTISSTNYHQYHQYHQYHHHHHHSCMYGTSRIAYRAPECFMENSGAVEKRTMDTITHTHVARQQQDVFSLGVIFGEIMTQCRPYDAWIDKLGQVGADVSILNFYERRIEDRIEPHALKDSGTPAIFQELVSHCLHREPSQRPALTAVVEQLIECLDQLKRDGDDDVDDDVDDAPTHP
jgi:hypothetical protein